MLCVMYCALKTGVNKSCGQEDSMLILWNGMNISECYVSHSPCWLGPVMTVLPDQLWKCKGDKLIAMEYLVTQQCLWFEC